MIFMLVEFIRGWLMPFPFWIGDTGKRGEYLARRYWHRRGYHKVAVNWRHGHGEIDLIMADWRRLLFVEVKTRREEPDLQAADTVGYDQKQRLLRLVPVFKKNWPDLELQHRFVIVLVAYAPGWRKKRFEVAPLA
ncbi:MAG: YraN family protein [Acidobacteriota bacterium]|nr:YraN family protein [Acidobacteriota bacterium]